MSAGALLSAAAAASAKGTVGVTAESAARLSAHAACAARAVAATGADTGAGISPAATTGAHDNAVSELIASLPHVRGAAAITIVVIVGAAGAATIEATVAAAPANEDRQGLSRHNRYRGPHATSQAAR